LEPVVRHGPGACRRSKKDCPTPEFTVQLRIQSALEEMPLVSVRCIAKVTHTSATTVFYILTEVLGLRFRHWRWVTHLLSYNQKVDRA
jgi:hypothetical protein